MKKKKTAAPATAQPEKKKRKQSKLLQRILAAVLTLLLRTWVGEHYYRVLDNWRYLALTIGLMTIASIGNLLLTGVVKYALLVAVLLAACVLFGKELRTLWTAALQIVSSILHKRRERA